MNYFESMVNQLSKVPVTEEKKTVTRTEYEIFCKEFIFDQLKGVGFGEAFCKRFDIEDNILPGMSYEGAKLIIESLGFIRK